MRLTTDPFSRKATIEGDSLFLLRRLRNPPDEISDLILGSVDPLIAPILVNRFMIATDGWPDVLTLRPLAPTSSPQPEVQRALERHLHILKQAMAHDGRVIIASERTLNRDQHTLFIKSRSI